MKRNIYPLSVIAAGILWGSMGIFRRHLGELGFGSLTIVCIRCIIASLLYAVTIAVTDRSLFKVRLRDLWIFLCDGIVSVMFFSLCYFTAMNMMSLSEAAILLYTAPIFVIVFSALLFGEKITGKKVLAIALAFGGCCLVSGIVGSKSSMTGTGLLFGLGAGIGYALYSVFSKFAIDRGYSSLTINLYSMLIAGAGCLLLLGAEPFELMFASSHNVLFCLLAAIVTTFLPYMLYAYGLKGVEPGKASVMASVEPVVATIIGYLVFGEVLGFWTIIGILLVLAAIAVLNINFGKAET